MNEKAATLKHHTMEKIRYRLVFNRRNRLNAQGKALIQVEASLNKRKVYFTTRIYIRPDEWDKRTATIVGHPHAVELNAWMYEFILQLESLELDMWKRGITPTLLQLKEATESNRPADTSFEAFSRTAIERSSRKKGTKSNLHGTLAQLAEYRPEYTWEDLTHGFLKNFERWLLDKGSAVNTVAKHLRHAAVSSGCPHHHRTEDFGTYGPGYHTIILRSDGRHHRTRPPACQGSSRPGDR